MKLIIALIQPHRLEAVKHELSNNDIHRLTVLDASGYGRQKGRMQYFRGQEVDTTLVDKVELQIALNDEFVQTAIDAIITGARSTEGGQVGDGKIFVVPLEDSIRISDGEHGGGAI